MGFGGAASARRQNALLLVLSLLRMLHEPEALRRLLCSGMRRWRPLLVEA